MKALCCNAGCSSSSRRLHIKTRLHNYCSTSVLLANGNCGSINKNGGKRPEEHRKLNSSRTISISPLGKVTCFCLIRGGCDKYRRILWFFNKMFLSYFFYISSIFLYFTLLASNFRDHVNVLPNDAKFRILGLK